MASPQHRSAAARLEVLVKEEDVQQLQGIFHSQITHQTSSKEYLQKCCFFISCQVQSMQESHMSLSQM